MLAVFAAAASFVVKAANHPRFGVARGEESEGDESEEPFHNGSALEWRLGAVVVKRNPTGVAVSFGVVGWGILANAPTGLIATVGGSEGVDGADDAFALLQGSPVTAGEAAETFPGGFGAVVGAVNGSGGQGGREGAVVGLGGWDGSWGRRRR